MRKFLLAAVALGGLMGLAATQASAAPVVGRTHEAAAAPVVKADYYYNHHHYQHRHWSHDRWRYY